MKEFVISDAQVEPAILVGLITQTQDERKTKDVYKRQAITMSYMNSYTQEHSMESFFGRVNYDFDNKYYLSARIRSDESSKFHPDHRLSLIHI